MSYHKVILYPKGMICTVKKVIRFALFTLATALLLATAAGAFAAEVTVSNRLDIKLSITLAYFDQDSGELVTKGWWHVEPHGQTVITVNADESREIYYAAYNKDQFVDRSTRANAQIHRWASPRNFTYATDAEPDEDGAWMGKFYQANGTSIEVDGTPRGN